ncbi:MAG: hypothetical protein ACK5GN_05830 [Pseudomonadota bacterium]|jgi:hypothetical protein
MRVHTSGSAAAIQSALEGLGGKQPVANAGWSEIVERINHYVQQGVRPNQSSTAQIDQLSGLLKLQMDVGRYQLRVELASKVSESAVASIRKLQQSQ